MKEGVMDAMAEKIQRVCSGLRFGPPARLSALGEPVAGLGDRRKVNAVAWALVARKVGGDLEWVLRWVLEGFPEPPAWLRA